MRQYNLDRIGPKLEESTTPAAYRLVRRKGELTLQGQYLWHRGFKEHGFDWRDIPTLEVEDV